SCDVAIERVRIQGIDAPPVEVGAHRVQCAAFREGERDRHVPGAEIAAATERRERVRGCGARMAVMDRDVQVRRTASTSPPQSTPTAPPPTPTPPLRPLPPPPPAK